MYPENNLFFTLVYSGEEYRIYTRRNQYHTLMTLISDYLAIDGFGLCSGMGSCGTCMVDICEKNTTVKRSALSCGLFADDELANCIVEIPAQRF